MTQISVQTFLKRAAQSRDDLDGRAQSTSIHDRRMWMAFAAIVAIIASSTRLVAFDSAYDLHVDEFIYSMLADSVQAGHFPPISEDGNFFVHPPAFFIWAAFWQWVLGSDGTRFDDIYLLRAVQQILSVVSAIAVFAIVRRAAGRWAGLVAGIVFAIDPFVLRINGRILLETATMAPIVVGLWVLVWHIQTGAAARWAPPAIGLLFGVAILTKDMAFFLTVVPLLVLLIARWAIPRGQAIVALSFSVIPYGLYLAYVLSRGLFGDWLVTKLEGVNRLLGYTVTTGYNSEYSPDLLSVIGRRLTEFGPSFAILALGGLAGVWLLLRPRHEVDRVLGLITVCAEGLIVYGMLVGTSEEHLFYFAMVPAILSLVTAIVSVLQNSSWGERVQRALAPLIVLVAVVTASVAMTWVSTRTSDDTGQQHAAAWLDANAPSSSLVAWVSPQTALSLEGDSFRYSELGSPPEMASIAQGTPFFLQVLHKNVEEGYAPVDSEELEFFSDRADLVFSTDSESYGEISIYRVWASSRW